MATGNETRMSDAPDELTEALRRMPVPEPTPDFARRVLARAVEATEGATVDVRSAARATGRTPFALSGAWRWWSGALAGAAAAAAVVMLVLQPVATVPDGVALVVDESREIMVLIDSERVLEDATISIHVTGNLTLTGYDLERDLQWRATLDQGSNVLSVPVTARSAGAGRIVAEIEHEGRVRRVAVDVVAEPPRAGGEAAAPSATRGKA